MKRRINLNHGWDFLPSFKKEYLGKPLKNAKKVSLPHTMKEIPLNYFNESIYQLVGTYSLELTIDQAHLKKNLHLHFGAVMTVASVYLNKELLLKHEGGYTPFMVDLTNKVKEGKNLLQVVVDGNEIKDIPPFGHFVDYLCFSGIYREVYLDILDDIYIKTLHVFTDEAASMHDDEMNLHIYLEVHNPSKTPLQVEALLSYDGEVAFTHHFKEPLTESFSYVSHVTGIKRWSIWDPNLYQLDVNLIGNDTVVASKDTRLGFRTVRFTAEGFYLNNQPLKLIGLNRHQSYPYVGYAMPKSMQVLDAKLLKEYGCNIVRTSHYMQSDHFLDACDELGLLVLEEIPGWQYIGNEHFKALSLDALETMITHHFNHPSICTWGVRINESADDHGFYEATNKLARELDSIRQTSGIRNSKKGDFLEDIYTYNDFSHVGNNPGLDPVHKVVKGYVPYLVTEHNGHVFPTKTTDHITRRIEHAIRHANVIDAGQASKRISGAIGWCMADYQTHFNFGSNDHICHHGVMDSFRIPKYAAYAYQSQTEERPVMFVANHMIPGDYKEFKLPDVVVFTNCDYIKVYKNGTYVKTYERDNIHFTSMDFPPIIIDDLIGDLILNEEDFSEADAKKITKLLLAFKTYGYQMPLKYKLSYLSLMRRKVVDFPRLYTLVEKYLSHQLEKPFVFTFEGYIDDTLVVTEKRGQGTTHQIVATPSHTTLVEDTTYDVARVVVQVVDEFDYPCEFLNEPITIVADDLLEIIGPKTKSLIAGSTAFYVKTTNKYGNANVTITSTRFGSKTLSFAIKKE